MTKSWVIQQPPSSGIPELCRVLIHRRWIVTRQFKKCWLTILINQNQEPTQQSGVTLKTTTYNLPY